MVETALILLLLAVFAFAAVSYLGRGVNAAFEKAPAALEGEVTISVTTAPPTLSDGDGGPLRGHPSPPPTPCEVAQIPETAPVPSFVPGPPDC